MEKLILEMINDGLTDAEIAEEFGYSFESMKPLIQKLRKEYRKEEH